jgi:hypothetical protein
MRREENVLPSARVRRDRRRFFILICSVWVPLGACGTSAIGVDICDSITSAQCTQAVALDCGADSGINLSVPTHPDNNASACIEFYKVACLHGLVTPTVPTTSQVDECVTFVNSLNANTVGACSFVAEPQTADACAWLIPPEAGADADADAAEADAADAADDTTDADAADVDAG